MRFAPTPSVGSDLHLVNRLTWGARPVDLQRVRQMGEDGYLDWQLSHEAIEDPLVDRYLADHPTLLADARGISAALDEDYGAVVQQFLWGRLYRAVYSERQLFEKMVEFWTDHFNVPAPDRIPERVIDDRNVARRHALGNFRDLLLASARSPAMLIYLDNTFSTKDGPNENYSREIMELHTLGVDGGYTQQDVKEVARCFTGWTLTQEWRGEFVFDRNRHDEGEKWVLGHRIAPERGIEDGLQVLDILATHPSTARFVSLKLCRRFVADEPPEGLVRDVAATFTATDGDIRAVLRTLFTSEEFRAARATKFRRPMEAVVAMLRALSPSVQINDRWSATWTLEQMGHLPFNWFPPNGYPDVADPWFNVNGLLRRWNAAMNLAYASRGWSGDGIRLNLDEVIPDRPTVGELVDAAWLRLVGYSLDSTTRTTLLRAIGGARPTEPVTHEFREDRLPALVGLILASPAFQLT